MPRSPTTLDPFNAIAEPKRREVLDALARASETGNPEVPVNDLVNILQWPQPQVSKHLRVLKEARFVDVESRAQQRLYGLRAEPLRDLNRWLERYRRIWDERMDQLGALLDEMNANAPNPKKNTTSKKRQTR